MGDSADSTSNVPEILWVVNGILFSHPEFEPGSISQQGWERGLQVWSLFGEMVRR